MIYGKEGREYDGTGDHYGSIGDVRTGALPSACWEGDPGVRSRSAGLGSERVFVSA